MNSENYLKDISEIKTLMNKSSKFISLSGMSGILAGIYALIGAIYAYWLSNKINGNLLFIDKSILNLIILDLFIVGTLSIVTAIFLTTRTAKKNNEKIWDSLTKRLLVSFLLPLLAGGIYILITFSQQRYGQIGELMLLFYGLALLNASKHTLGDIKYLGYTQIILGLISALFSTYSFWFWVIGFGFMHIIYGFIMYFKYDKKN
jgi:predicted lysophospholipase L1 biosynthesis ABC-type transport system permease subunit